MPTATPDRVLDKFKRLHERYSGSDRGVVKFVKYESVKTDFWGDADSVTPTETVINPPPIIKNQADENLVNVFGEGLADALGSEVGKDVRVFFVVSDSFVPRTPVATLAQRAEDFLYERADPERGGILYGGHLYAIKKFVARPIIGSVPARFAILAVSQRKSSS